MHRSVTFSFASFCESFCKSLNDASSCSAPPMPAQGTPDCCRAPHPLPAAEWQQGQLLTGHPGMRGTAATTSPPLVVKEVVLARFSVEFCHFLAKELENNSAGISTRVVTFCDTSTASHMRSSAFPLKRVYIQSLGLLYINFNVTNELGVTHRKPVEKISCRHETQPCSIWF